MRKALALLSHPIEWISVGMEHLEENAQGLRRTLPCLVLDSFAREVTRTLCYEAGAPHTKNLGLA